jgi:flagellum-specific peptidoglycan hydrolase FlgJ
MTTPDLLFAEQDARLYETGSYSTDPEYQTSSYIEIFATLTQTQLGTGEVTVIVNYS